MRKKLFLSTIAIVLLSLILSMVSVNLVFKQQFRNYLSQTTESTLKQLPDRLSRIYQSKGEWDPAALEAIGPTLPIGTEVILRDPKGNFIAKIMNPMDEMMTGKMGAMMGTAIQEWKTKTLTISEDKKTLAVADVRYPAEMGILNPQDMVFISEIFHSLLLAAGLALIIGVLLSWWTSRRLVLPLQRLTKASYLIGQGKLTERVSISSNDETGQLAEAFNLMAENLGRQEHLRKQFTADIAHELRTPLTSIQSYIEAFQDGVLPPDSENLTAINEEIDRLVDLVNDLKDLNVAEMGSLSLNPQKIDLKLLLDKVIRNIFTLIEDKHLILEWNPPVQTIPIYGDERLLIRLFYNLLHNAYSYTEQGGKISIQINKSSSSVTITVRDNGIGIPEKDIPYIFERFYRADKSRTRQTGGTGIGLALVKQIVVMHEGTIQVKSELGKGSEFMVSLPLKISKERP